MDRARKVARRLDIITERAEFSIELRLSDGARAIATGPSLSGKKSASPPEGRCRSSK
jgi:hypothetical protein